MQFDAPDVAEEARRCEADSLSVTYGLTRAFLDTAFQRYEENSAFLTISDDDGIVAAAARVITPGPAGLVSFHDMATEGWGVDGHVLARQAGLDLTTTWDMASFCRRPDTPGGNRRALAMVRGLSLAMQANGATVLVGILNESVRSYLAMYGLVFTTLPGIPGEATRPYTGSTASTPVFARHGDFLDTAREVNPEGYRLVALGMGMDDISVPPLSEFVLDRPRRVIDLVAAESVPQPTTFS